MSNWHDPIHSPFGMGIETFNRHHNTTYNSWSEVWTEIGMTPRECASKDFYPIFQQKYNAYCKFMRSPLSQELK